MKINSISINRLVIVGAQLDANIFPMVGHGGIVLPGEHVITSIKGSENKDEESGQRRSATSSRQWASGRQRPSGGTWTSYGARAASTSSSLISRDSRDFYECQIEKVQEAYPSTQVWTQDKGIWLRTESSLLPDLRRKAIFLIGLSFVSNRVRAWGFWGGFPGAIWIGPRHTNFPDGSICAFEPTDGTWVFGLSPLVQLLDIYSVWAVRHLYLEHFGRWPGPQAVHFPYERLLEQRRGELCGCSDSSLKYESCCMSKDLSRDRLADALDYCGKTGGGVRNPPDALHRFVLYNSSIPKVEDFVF